MKTQSVRDIDLPAKIVIAIDHAELLQQINKGLTPLRKSQPDAMQALGQLERRAMSAPSTKRRLHGFWSHVALLGLHCLSGQVAGPHGMLASGA